MIRPMAATPVQALSVWRELGATLVAARQARSVDWGAVRRIIDVAQASFALKADRLEQLLVESRKLLEPFGDPLEVDFGAHRWLAGDREEAYSDWLQWIIQQ